MLRCMVEGWHGNPPLFDKSYEDEYKEMQWKVHKRHLQHNALISQESKGSRFSGVALARAKPLLSPSAHRNARQDKRRADELRHPERGRKVWVVKDNADTVVSSLRSEAQEFTPLGIDNFLAYFLPAQETFSDTTCVIPQLIPSVSSGLPLVSAGGVGEGYDDWSSIVKDVLWQVHHLSAQMDALRAQFDPLDVLETLAGFDSRMNTIEAVESSHQCKLSAHVENLRGDIREFGVVSSMLEDMAKQYVESRLEAHGDAIIEISEQRCDSLANEFSDRLVAVEAHALAALKSEIKEAAFVDKEADTNLDERLIERLDSTEHDLHVRCTIFEKELRTNLADLQTRLDDRYAQHNAHVASVITKQRQLMQGEIDDIKLVITALKNRPMVDARLDEAMSALEQRFSQLQDQTLKQALAATGDLMQTNLLSLYTSLETTSNDRDKNLATVIMKSIEKKLSAFHSRFENIEAQQAREQRAGNEHLLEHFNTLKEHQKEISHDILEECKQLIMRNLETLLPTVNELIGNSTRSVVEILMRKLTILDGRMCKLEKK